VATVTTVVTAVATLGTLTTMAAVVNAAMAAIAAVAAVAGNSRRISTGQDDRDQREEHRNRNSEKTLHLKPPKKDETRHAFQIAVTFQPRSGTATGPQQPDDHSIARRFPTRNPRTTGSTPLQALTVGEDVPIGKSRLKG